MIRAHAPAIRRGCQPRCDVGPEKVKPGSDGVMTWKSATERLEDVKEFQDRAGPAVRNE